MDDPKPRNHHRRDYVLIGLNILIILLLTGSIGLTVMGQTGLMMTLAGPLGFLALLAGLRRRK